MSATENLSNGILELCIAHHGAELQSIRRVTAPTEYLWQGDPAYWERRAPVLFPIVGKVWQDTARFGERSTELRQHGFARDMMFEKCIDEDRHMAFRVTDDEDSRQRFPFRFELRIDYTLLRNVITVGWAVTNNDGRPMPFQIGAHPAFQYPRYAAGDEIHGYLSFDTDGPLVSSAVRDGFATDKQFDVVLPADGLLPLTNDTFACDTIVEATGRIHRVTLHNKEGRPVVTVRHQMPITALWAPRAGMAPFVCIEPWHGRCDSEAYQGDFALREHTECVLPGQTWSTSYQIIIE